LRHGGFAGIKISDGNHEKALRSRGATAVLRSVQSNDKVTGAIGNSTGTETICKVGSLTGVGLALSFTLRLVSVWMMGLARIQMVNEIVICLDDRCKSGDNESREGERGK